MVLALTLSSVVGLATPIQSYTSDITVRNDGSLAVGATKDQVYPLRIDDHTLEFWSKAKLEGPRFKVGLTFPFQSFAGDYRRSVRYWESDYRRPELTSPQKSRAILISLISFFTLLCVMYLLWPKKPKGKLSQDLLLKSFSPATIGYSVEKKYHPGLFMASLLNLVNAKVIYIEAISLTNHFEIEADREQNALFEDEEYIVSRLFTLSANGLSRSDQSDSSSRFKDCSKGHERLIAEIRSGKTGTGRLVIFGIISVAVFLFNVLNVQTDMPTTELLGLSFVTLLFSVVTIFMWVISVILPFCSAETMWKKIMKVFSLSTLLAMLFTLPSTVSLFYLIRQTGWLLIYTLLVLIVMNLLFYILPPMLRGAAEPLVAEAAEELKQTIILGEVQVNSQKEYLQYLALSYGLGVQNQFEQQFQGDSLMEQCPGRIDKELWDNGSAAPLFDHITRLL